MRDQPKSGDGLSRSLRSAKAVNLRSIYADLYHAEETPRLLRVPAAKYLTLRPRYPYNGSQLIDHMQLLYDVGFAVKTHCRQENPKYRPYAMTMVEVLSWGNEPGIHFVSGPRVEWNWGLILRSPAFVTPTDLEAGINALRGQGKVFAAEDIELQVLDEGECIQALLRGEPTDDMDIAIRAKRFARASNVVLTGLQHEIFVTNILHVRPLVREVVFRFPVKPAGAPSTLGPPFK
jgi:hypothetical protein